MKRIIIIIGLSILIFSCNKPSSPLPTPSNPPVILSLNPGSGHPGAVISIAGHNFSSIASENIVKFNGIAATAITADSTSITVKVPVGSGAGIVSVTNNSGTGNGPSFNYDPDIFILGLCAANTLPANNRYLEYWKNGVPHIVTDSSLYLQCSTMAIKDTDIYIPFTTFNSTFTISTGKYLKNGVIYNLTDGKNNSSANSICMTGNDVYIGGFESNGTHNIAKYWKNGVPVSLTDGTANAEVNDITINGSDVYAVGSTTLNTGITVATYWKNGVATSLSSAVNNGSAFSISISNNNLYVVGAELIDSTGMNIAEYWKNGVPGSINYGDRAIVYQVKEFSGDLYMIGQQTTRALGFWKNGNLVNLASPGAIAGFIHCMTTYGSDIYLTGEEKYTAGSIEYIGEYWKNGVLTQLTKPTDPTPIFESIIVR